MKKILVIAAALLVFALPVVSNAEIREGSFEVSPFAGFHIFDQGSHSFITGKTSDEQKGFSNGLVYGLRVGYNITDRLGVEGVIDRVESRANLFHADLLYHFTPERAFNPYFVAGIGYAHIMPEHRNHYESLMGNFGLGFKYFFNRHVAFRADVRDIVTNMQNVVATAGLTFAFGGKTPQPAPAPAPAPAPKPAPAPAPAPVPAPKPEVKPAPAPAPVKIVLEDVHFDFDKATLTKEAIAILGRDIKTLRDNPSVKVQIEGHTCAHGKEAYNMALGERRANSVKEYLVKEGVSADRLSTISYGETRLAMPEVPTPKNKNSKEAKENRRVHFEVIVK